MVYLSLQVLCCEVVEMSSRHATLGYGIHTLPVIFVSLQLCTIIVLLVICWSLPDLQLLHLTGYCVWPDWVCDWLPWQPGTRPRACVLCVPCGKEFVGIRKHLCRMVSFPDCMSWFIYALQTVNECYQSWPLWWYAGCAAVSRHVHTCQSHPFCMKTS